MMDGNLEEMANLEKQRQMSMNLLPVIIIMVGLGLVGIIGNSLTAVFYIRRNRNTSSITLIICLAVVDLAVCVLLIPSILEMTSTLTYYQGFMCKLSHFCTRWTISSSCVIIWIISIDRYRKICKPFGKQITNAMVKRAMYATTVFTFLLSVKNFVVFDSVPVTIHDNKDTFTGHFCTTHKNDEYRHMVLVFYGVDASLISVMLGTLTVTYSNVSCTLVKLGNKRKRRIQNLKLFEEIVSTKLPKRSIRISSDISGITRNATEVSLLNYATVRDIDRKSKDDLDNSHDACGSNSTIQDISKENKQCTKASCVKRSKENNLTLMMLIVSLFCILCFAPYFAVRLILRHGDDNDEFELSAGVQFLLRLVYVNSVINPIIYCIFNPTFRKFIKQKLACADVKTT